MSRRIDIELTSARDDGSWTWRAAGALQPRGVLDGKALYPGASVGDVARAEADFEIDGISILSVTPPKAKRPEPERLEIIGPPREHAGVTSSLAPRRDRDRDRPRDRDRDRDRGGRGERRDRRPDGGAGGPGGASPSARRGPPREREGATPDATGTGPRRPRAAGPRPERRPVEKPAPPPPKPKPKRLNPANVHRAAVLESLPVEQRPIAEHLLRGGIPAVRQAIETDNAKARAEGRQETSAEALLTLAEGLLPRLKAAEWRDRAEAAMKSVDEIGLRDLRAVVAGAEAVARDDESRTLASQLREALQRRATAELDEWLGGITSALDEARVVRALRLSAHPPDPTSRLTAELATRLSEAAGTAMSPDAMPDRWATLLDAVSASPVRRSVKPAGLPAEPGPALLQAAQQAAGRVPALAAMLGIDIPPPPGPIAGRGAATGRPGREGARRGPRPPGPPRPPRPQAAIPPPPPAAAPAEAPSGHEPPDQAPPVAAVEEAPAAPAPAEPEQATAEVEDSGAAPPAEAPPPPPAPETAPSAAAPDSPGEAVARSALAETPEDQPGTEAPAGPTP